MSVVEREKTPLPASVCGLVPVGPGEGELVRLDDLLDSIVCCEPLISSVVLVDDSVTPRDLKGRYGQMPLSVHCIHHPRMGRGSGIWGGLTEGVLTGLHYIHTRLTEPYILRLDGDSIIIQSFVTRLHECFSRNPTVGVVGTVYRKPDGTPRTFDPWANHIRHLTKRLGRCRNEETPNLGRRYLQTLWGGGRRIRNLIEKAMSQGYTLGEHAQGGGYAVRREVLHTIEELGGFRSPSDWRPLFFSEDVCVSLFARAGGWGLMDFNREGEIFGVQHWGIPGSPEVCVERGYGVLHSLKHDVRSEKELRERFVELRGSGKRAIRLGVGERKG